MRIRPRRADATPSGTWAESPRLLWPIAAFGVLVVLAGAFSAGTAITVVVAARWLKVSGVFQPEILLPLLLVAGLVALVVALAILVAAFQLFGLANPDKPFGVPEGTLQVVIALSLIMVFAITSLYLRASFQDSVAISGLTQAQVDQIDATQLISVRPSVDDPERLDIVQRVPIDEDAKDFSTQLLTILGTLVGAVAGFYFGAKSVETGVSAAGGEVPPTNTAIPTITGGPLVGETLRAEDGGWTGSPPPKYGHQWQRKRGEGLDWSDIPGANASSYLLAGADAGHTVRVAVTAVNTAGSQTAYSAETQTILQAPAPPTTGIELGMDGAARIGVALRVTHEPWSSTPPPSITYQWQRKRPSDEQWTDIPGANETTYVATAADVAHAIRVAVSASNAAGTTTTWSAETQVIPEPPNPPASGIRLEVDGPLAVGAVLRAAHEPWSGAPQPSITYQWQRRRSADADWSDIAGATEPTYTVTADDAGQAIRVVVSGTNAAETRSAPSDEHVVPEAPPEESAAEVSDTTPAEEESREEGGGTTQSA